LVAIGLLVRRTVRLRDEANHVVPSRDPWTPILDTRPEPDPEPQAPPDPVPAWLAPVDGACPPTHLIKAKSASGIYHLPGMVNYQRTRPDRCYAEPSAAEADGFTQAKR
jgi:hypothetical protein